MSNRHNNNASLKTIHSNIESNIEMFAKACGLIEKDLISCKKIELSGPL